MLDLYFSGDVSDVATDAEILQQAQTTLARAIAELYPGTRVSRESLANILGLVWGENKFGTTPDWQESNNWGSVRCYRQDPASRGAGFGCVMHGDRDAQGQPVTVPFQRYPSQLEGAKGFLRTLLRTPEERAALATGDPVVLARAMYAARYFTGTTGTDEQRIQTYAGLIRRGATRVKALLGPSLGVFQPGGIPPFGGTNAPPFGGTTLLLSMLALGTGIWYYLTSRVPRDKASGRLAGSVRR